MKPFLFILIFVGFAVPVRAYRTVKLIASRDDSDVDAYFLVKIAEDDGITYCAETFYQKGEDPKKKGKKRFIRSSNRAYGEFGRGGRLLKYRRWVPGAGSSIMYMVFRYGSRIRRRVEEVLGGSAKVATLTRGRTIHVVDPIGPGWLVVLLRFKGLKSFKCVNPVTGKVGTEVITKEKKRVILPQRGEIRANVLNFHGHCGEAEAFLTKKGRLIGGKKGNFVLEIPLKSRRKR